MWWDQSIHHKAIALDKGRKESVAGERKDQLQQEILNYSRRHFLKNRRCDQMKANHSVGMVDLMEQVCATAATVE